MESFFIEISANSGIAGLILFFLYKLVIVNIYVNMNIILYSTIQF